MDMQDNSEVVIMSKGEHDRCTPSPPLFSQYAQDPLEGFTEMFQPWDVETQTGSKRKKPSSLLYQRAQDSKKCSRRQVFEEAVEEEFPPSPPQSRKMSRKNPYKKKSTVKCASDQQASFVVKCAPSNGRRLIQIKIIDISDSRVHSELEEDNTLLSAQYVVQDNVDQIMDQTEGLINNISKKICGYSYCV